MRAIYAYHAQTLDWCDIGYNALVDKYGQIFEGRAGGLDKPVQGAHAGGFNENTVGVAMMGNYDEVEPSKATLESTGKFIGWRLQVQGGLDPQGTTTMYSEGTEFTPYAEGEEVELPVIFAHRDVGNTECAGEAAYNDMDKIRDIAERTVNSSGSDVQASAPDADQLPDAGTDADSSPAPARPTPPSAAENGGLPALAEQLVRLTDTHPIAQRWAALGGPLGQLGPALSGILPAKDGRQYAKFTNGYIYSAPSGQLVTVVGKILQEFIEMGLDSGALGLPLTDEIPIPEGYKTEFEKGALIFNQATGFVTAILKTYNDAYTEEYNNPSDAAAPLPAPAPAPEAIVPAPEPIG
ncbi:N-acetylmuramoyl-L-alanine amidase [Antrihabitans spumae]|uniref:N-acetylmuramoyl-L-alanine amidase n=1 Tax=Antrihabitans spumae TaxID=3373370 RepID=UPI003A9270DF